MKQTNLQNARGNRAWTALARVNPTAVLLMFAILAASHCLLAAPADSPSDPARDREMRERYEGVLLKNPFQDRAFNQVYESYSKVEGVEKWIETLKPKAEGADAVAIHLLLGQIYDRQFKTAEAVTALEKAAEKGETRPQFKVLLGTLYYKSAHDDKAGELLSSALDSLTDLDQRAAVCRMLGNLYLRQNKRDEAIAVWKRVAEQNPGEIFAQLELAEIYEDNRMWTNAIGVYRAIADRAKDDPYRRCRALRSIGQAMVQSEQFKDAIAIYEQALDLVAPGNWLFEDLKLRLVGVYEDIGDLAGLVKYLNARLEQNPADLEFRDLLAETYMRMSKFEDAEKQYKLILERNPRASVTYEKLIALYTRTARKPDVAATFEKLIELYPTDTDYLRRFGESFLRDNDPEKAKQTWRRLVKDSVTGEKLAQLASWFESYEFPEEAITTYQQALEKGKQKDWALHLAGLKFQKGDEEAAVKLWLGVIDPATSKVEDYAEVASILESHNKIDEAARLRKAAAEKDPANLDARLSLAKTLMRQQKHEDAAAEYEKLAAQNENEFIQQQAESGQLEAWREMGVLADKQKAWESALESNAQDSKVLGRLARLYERIGQRQKAIELYEHRRAAEPDNIEHLRSLASLYAAAKQTEQAIETFKTLLNKDKNRARVYQKELLDIYLSVDLKEDAITAAKEIVSLAPSDPEARLTLAQVYQTYLEPEKALNEYRYALRLEPNEPDYHRQYAEALEAEKRYGDAQEAYRKMLDVAKEDSTRLGAVGSLARIHQQQERVDDLLSEFSRRIRNTPKKLAAYEELAVIHKETGQIFKSVEVLENGLQNVDDKTSALKALIRTGFEAQDFEKVKNYYEQLVAMSGKPSPQELEKLGQIYAQMGDIEKARATWNRILAEAPKDAKAADRLAGLLRGQGFTDEALVVKARAVELDPQDYRRRYEYAQLLQQSDQPVEAMNQLTMILEIGDREEAEKKEKEKEKKVQKINRGQQGGLVNAYQFAYGGRNYGRYFGGGWQGSFKQFRPQVLQYMATVAQQSIGEEAFLERIKENISKRPDDMNLQRDYLMTLQMFNRGDDALKLAESILEKVPDDVDLLQQTALFYSDQQKLDKAIPLLERLAKSQPKYRLQAVQGLVPLYFKNKQETNALELVNQVLTENPSDTSLFYMMANVLQQNGKHAEARKVYEKVAQIDPKQKSNIRISIANLAKSSGKQEEARALFREILLSETPAHQSPFNVRRRVDIYSPQVDRNPNRGYYGNPMQSLPQNAIAQISYEKSQAFQELKQKGKNPGDDTNNIVNSLEEVALSYSAKALPAARDRAWQSARLLTADYIIEKQLDKATNLLNAIHQKGYDEIDWYNAALYVAQQREDYPGMIELYNQLLQRYPAKARDITVAKTMTYILAKQEDKAAKNIRELNQQRVPPAMVLGLIRALMPDNHKAAKELLEEHLSGVSRNSEALATLAQLYAKDDDHPRAIALANEAWERKAHGRQGGGNYFYSGYYYSSYMPSGGQIDGTLRQLHGYYVAAGKSEELIKRFSDALEKQPGSVQAHENLAELYRLNNNRDKALELYQALASKRPHLSQVKRTIASLYTEMGEFQKATEYYEQLMKANPQLVQSFQWELRNIYQRMGKGKELAKMEEKMVEKARDPSQMWNLAYQLRDSGEVDKALELFRKADKLQPGQPWMKGQLAGILVEIGQLDEALSVYQQWLDSPALRANRYVDHPALKQLAGLYRATGKLDELKTRCEADLKKNSTDVIATALKTHIALLEKRFDDGLAAFKATVQANPDSYVVNELVNLAEISGRVDDVLAIAEGANQQQNYWELQSLARLYFAKGDLKKGEDAIIKWADQQIQQGNGGWAMREAMQQLSRFECWEAAEKFVRKHRDGPMQQYEAEQFDRAIATAYIEQHRFESVVDELLTKTSFKGRDLALLKCIAQQYRENEPAKRRAFLERICAADPKNKELAFELASLYDDTETEQKLVILKRLIQQDPQNPQYQEAHALALVTKGQTDDAMKALSEWVAARPTEPRYTLLAKQQRKLARFAEARASYLKAIELVDSSKKADAKLRLSEFDAEQGDSAVQEKALNEFFAQRKDAGAFGRYVRYMREFGFPKKAHEFFVANREKGFVEQYSATDFASLCLDYGDYKTPMEVSWQFARYGERWNRDHYLDQVVKYYQNRGKLTLFLDDLQKRVDAEAPKHRGMLKKLGSLYVTAGDNEKALATYNRLLELSPFGQEFRQAKIDLLINLERGDEAIAMLRDGRGVMNLNDEISAKCSLIRALYRLKRNAEAEKETAELLAWARGGSPMQQLAEVLFGEKQYAPSAELFENASKLRGGWEGDQLRVNLGICYAKLDRLEEALKVWSQLSGSANRWTINRLQDTLEKEGLQSASEKLIQAQITKSPNVLDLYFQLAKTLNNVGKDVEAIAVFDVAAQTVDKEKQKDLVNRLAELIHQRRSTEAALRHYAAKPNAVLGDALIRLLGMSTDEPETSALILKQLETFAPEDPKSQILLADALLKAKRQDEALAWYRKIVNSTNINTRLAVVPGLVRAGAASEASPILVQLFKQRPAAFVNDTNLLYAIAQSRDEKLIGDFLKYRAGCAVNPAETNYFAAVLAYYSGRTNDAKALIAALAQAPTLSGGQLWVLSAISETGQWPELKAAFLRRLMGGGYPTGTHWQAGSELVSLHVSRNEFNEAVRVLAMMLPVWNQGAGEKARDALAKAITPANFPDFKKAVIELVKASPNEDQVSNLVGFCAQLSQSVGGNDTAMALAAAANAGPLETAESSAWDNLVERWEIAGPFRGRDIETILPPETADKTETQPIIWTHSDPKAVLGVVRLEKCLDLKKSDKTSLITYARTQIDSGAERTESFLLGSSCPVKVWINDKPVLTHTGTRECNPDQNRFSARLKKGVNHVLVKLAGSPGQAAFCFRVAPDQKDVIVSK